MRTRRNTGFTLVEILIVVVILGILAAIVIPQFTSASQEAVKGALQSQLQTIESQFELFRVRNQGTAPTLPDTTDTINGGWGIMVSSQYLKEAPFNGFTKSSDITLATGATPNIAAGPATAAPSAWGFRDADATATPPLNAVIFAFGFDHVNNMLSNEVGTPAYSQAVP
ncbi:MAG: hypothetical protein CVV40_00550 [Planctomycetes bacterium HGW-Planctomycetes-2]|nr:MAG: hypothetical protein CVV40_00550 [Planctomycetes bacterium HGW-Planctomycetes-2]